MNSRLLAIVLAAMVFTSCQKEITLSDVLPPGPGGNPTVGNANAFGITGGTNGSMILRAVRKLNGDSVVATFTYDSNDRMMSYTALGREKYDTLNINYKFEYYYTRDALGRVVSYTSPNTMDTTFFGQLDSIRTTVYYSSPTSSEFRAIVSKMDMGIATGTDSTVYTFANGRVAASTTYSVNDLFGGAMPEITSKSEFNYDAVGNVREHKIYAQPTSGAAGLVLRSVSTYTYDNKKNAQEFKNEAFFFNSAYMGPNNIVKVVQQLYDPVSVNTVSAAYNYNTNDRPQNGQMLVSSPVRNFTLTYYYK